jgi:triosephosphate isomerase
VIFINFKTYEKGTGSSAMELVKQLEEVAVDAQVKTIPVVQAADIKEVVGITKLEVWTQKIDPVDYGAHTGAVLPEAVVEDGASGTFLNHSECKFEDYQSLEKAIKRCDELDLKTLVFAANIDDLEKVLKFKPTFVSYEPPELVGSETTSVAKENPEIIIQAVARSRAYGIPLIVGAGIKSKEDVRKSLELGAVGVAVASDIVKSDNPVNEYTNLIEGFRG